MKNLGKTGLSLSQASSISNLCNQRAIEIENTLSAINNCGKVIELDGKSYVAQQPRQMPSDVIELVLEKGRLYATQAFLMENINEKDRLIKAKEREPFITKMELPVAPEQKKAVVLPAVKETWAWAQFTADEMAEYIQAEAFAAHIGQFIHRGSILDRLRRELPEIKTLEWMTPPGDKPKAIPMTVSIHHDPTDLMALHEKLAAEHRIYEQKVNYYKSKAKTLTTEENARISNVNADEQSKVQKENSDLMNDYALKVKEYNEKLMTEKYEFEANRQKSIKELAALRIQVHTIFQPLIDEFLKKLESK